MSWSSALEAIKDALYYSKVIKETEKEEKIKEKELKKQNKKKQSR